MSRILVVEDSRTQAEQLRLVLEAAQFDVTVAPDGQRGLDVFRATPFDLVISDVLMPGLSGYDLCRRIKDGPAGKQVSVILLTTLRDPADIIEGLECGADNFVTKPYQPDYLVARVRALLANQALRVRSTLKVGAEVLFLDKKFTITADKEQILGLLVTVFEDIVRTNRELQQSQAGLRQAKAQVEQYARLLEGQVRSSEDKYRRLMDQANDAIFVSDPASKILEVNRRAEQLLDRSAAEIVGRSYEEFLPAAELDLARAQFQKLLAEGSVRMDNTHLKRADGRLPAVDYSAALVQIAGARVVLAIVHDVTERNRLEQQLHQAQKMEAIGQLAGGVAHDFNNLLTIISGYSEVLLGGPGLEPPTRGLIEEIKKAGERAASLTRQLLAFSRQQVIAPKVLDLNAVVADTDKMLRRLIGEDIDLTCVLDPGLGFIKADPGQVNQVLMNLAINARDAMPRGGRLTIETANVDLDAAAVQARPEVKPGPYVMLAVTDTGCGMDEATKARLFEPFFTSKGPGKGTGLGLATVYGIVKQSGGYIYVHSEVDRGTVFKSYLPRVAAAAPEPPPPRGERLPRPAAGETLLLVEDEDAVRALTRHALQLDGYTVLAASHPGEAIRLCERHDGLIALLLTDVVMPQMGGRELANRLTALRPEMKVLFLSGYTDDAVVRHGVLEAETDFLQKPFTLDALTRKVREVLAGERRLLACETRDA
jgi:PAS domain S-box-containing protein